MATAVALPSREWPSITTRLAAGTPGPGTEGTAIVELAVLAFVDSANDALCKTSAVVRLNACGGENRVAPAFFENEIRPGAGGEAGVGTGRSAEAEFEKDGRGAFNIGRSGEGELDVDAYGWVGRVVDMACELFDGDRDAAFEFAACRGDLPGDFGS